MDEPEENVTNGRGQKMRAYALTFGLAFFVLAFLTACSRDPNAEANKLFVEAQQLIEKADKQERPAEKLVTFREAEARLKSIVTDYPSSNLAVQLSSGQSVGKISLQGAADATTAAEQSGRFEVPNKKCLYEQALLTAHSVQDGAVLFNWGGMSSNFSRFGFLGAVAAAQAKAGLDKISAATFELAQEAAKKAPGDFGAVVLAPMLAGVGRGADALRLIQGISDDARRAYMLMAIARAQATAGLRNEAAATLEQAVKLKPAAGDDLTRIGWLTGVAYVKALLGASSEATSMVDEAARLANSLSTPNDASRHGLLRSLADIAEVQLKIGQTAAASGTLNNALNVAKVGTWRDSNIYTLLNGRTTLGGFADVKKITESMSDEPMRSSILYSGAKGRAEDGRIPDAQQVLYAIKVDYFRAQTFAALAQAQAKAKLTSQADQTVKAALQIVRSLPNKAMQAYALLAVGQALP